MQILKITFLLLIFSAAAFSQYSLGVSPSKGNFDFENPNEKIIAYDFFETDEKLRLIGKNTIQIWDVKNNKVLDSRKHEIENLSDETFGGISPDKTKLIVLGFERRGKEKDAPKEIIPAKIYDLESGKLLVVLDKSRKFIASAIWSKDGKTLVTADNELLKNKYFYHKDETEISFFDGKTLELRGSTVIKDLTWYYLSDDGDSFFTTSVPEKKGWFWIPFVNGMANVINIWNTRTAKNGQNLSVGDENFHTHTFKLMPSPDGKFFALVSKNKDTDDQHRVLVWQIGNGALPKYAIKANPKIRESMISYSPDGKYFALDAGRNVQIYELETGKMTGEFVNPMLPSYWLDDNQIVLYHLADKIRAVQIQSGNVLFEEPVIYRTETRTTGTYSTDSSGNSTADTETYTVDWTRIVPHSDTKMFLTFSNQSVKVYDADGKLREVLITPPPVVEKKVKILKIIKLKFKDFGENTVKRAEWSADGKSILVLNAKETAVSVWQLKD